VKAALKARQAFITARENVATAAAAPLQAFVLVDERMGSNDGPSFGEQAYLDFATACAALKARTAQDFDPELDDDLQLKEYLQPESFAYFFNVETERGEVCHQYYLQKFTLCNAGVVAEGGAA